MLTLNFARQFIKKILPTKLLNRVRPFGHSLESWLSHYLTGRPSDKLVVIGITGTKGKTSTAHITYQLLNLLRVKAGLISTAVLDSGDGEKMNKYRMTQLSGRITHELLAKMVKAGYKYAVLEVSSEGLAQGRHKGINFDIAVFTNLTPDHIEAHGSFENYKMAKGILFKELSGHTITKAKKEINSHIVKTIISNLDSEHGLYYLNFKATKHMSYGIVNDSVNVRGQLITESPFCILSRINGHEAHFDIPGGFNLYNVLASFSVLQSLGYDELKIIKAIEKLKTIPGRMEIIQREPFMVLVDYAHEKASMQALYGAVTGMRTEGGKIIQVFGATGGVRDKSRRTDLGKMAGEFTDIAIVTDEDPFDEDPQNIIHDIADAVVATGKKEIGKNLFRNPNRREAIAKALSLAQTGDIVLITGKGAEQKIARANGTYEDWDDRMVVREELEKLKSKDE